MIKVFRGIVFYLKGIETNMIIAIGVLCVSVGTLWTSFKQAQIMNEQTRIFLEQYKSNSWPRIEISMNRGFTKSVIENYEFLVSNKGTGPAIIEWAVIAYNDQGVRTWSDFYNKIEIPDDIIRSHSNSGLTNQVISANENIRLIDWSSNPKLMNLIHEKSNAISITICYSSVYGDCWVVKKNGFKTGLEPNETTAFEVCEKTTEIMFLE